MEKIDFVITWVDGNDPEWQKEKSNYQIGDKKGNSNVRYRDMGLLPYWFRAVEKYAPWVNKIHFVTWGHLPKWLNTDNEKLNIVKHTDYIPEEYLPTFSSHPIELNMHRIKGLSEKFVYFNDDMFLNQPIKPEFFFKNGLPCDYIYISSPYYDGKSPIFPHILFSEAQEASQIHSYMKSFFRHPFKFMNIKYPFKECINNLLKLSNRNLITGIDIHHLASAYSKKTYEEIWDKCYETLDSVSKNKFRTPYDVSHTIFRYHQLFSGRFTPVSKKTRGKNLNLALSSDSVINALFDDNCPMLCINDSEISCNFEEITKDIIEAFDKKFPEKSGYEL